MFTKFRVISEFFVLVRAESLCAYVHLKRTAATKRYSEWNQFQRIRFVVVVVVIIIIIIIIIIIVNLIFFLFFFFFVCSFGSGYFDGLS